MQLTSISHFIIVLSDTAAIRRDFDFPAMDSSFILSAYAVRFAYIHICHSFRFNRQHHMFEFRLLPFVAFRGRREGISSRLLMLGAFAFSAQAQELNLVAVRLNWSSRSEVLAERSHTPDSGQENARAIRASRSNVSTEDEWQNYAFNAVIYMVALLPLPLLFM